MLPQSVKQQFAMKLPTFFQTYELRKNVLISTIADAAANLVKVIHVTVSGDCKTRRVPSALCILLVALSPRPLSTFQR